MKFSAGKKSILDGKWILTFEDNSWWRKVVGLPARRMFIGSGTVWFTYPQFKRCNTSLEGRLAEEAERLECRYIPTPEEEARMAQ